MRQYTISGMSCAACQAKVEKAVSKVPGVDSCTVNLLTGIMAVEGSAPDKSIIDAVVRAGYGAERKADRMTADTGAADREFVRLRNRLLAGIAFLLLLFYLAMGHGMWGWPVPDALKAGTVANGLAQMALSAVILGINRKFFLSGVKGVLHGAPNMDTLVALGSGTSFVYSLVVLGRQIAGGEPGGFYFDSAAMITVLITVGKMLEAASRGRTTDALRALKNLAPKTVARIRDGQEIVIPAEELQVGDVFAVRPGESFAADGVVLEGESAVDESTLTGESIPVDKAPGDPVSAATVNRSGYLRIRAEKVGEDTVLSRIIQMVGDASATKAPIAKIADRVSGIFVPAVLGIALITFVIWTVLGRELPFALARAVSVLVISCPCALGLATPVAIMVGSGVAAKRGILFKSATALEEAGKCRILVLDKTGTVTKGEPEVREIVPLRAELGEKLRKTAFALEAKSEHPLAGAVVRKMQEEGREAEDISGFRAVAGNGLEGVLDGVPVQGGTKEFLKSRGVTFETDRNVTPGTTPMYFAADGQLLGMISVADEVKEDSREAVKRLEGLGIAVVMLTGDGETTAKAVSEAVGIRHFASGVMPGEKANVVKLLSEGYRVAMVGDGINDAPALTEASVGIAIGAGTDVALDAADVVVMNSRLSDVCTAICLSRATGRNIRENLFWAFFYNALCIPLAAGCLIGVLGWQLSPMVGAAAMSLSSFCVVMNALRLNLFREKEAGGRCVSAKTDEKTEEILNRFREEKNRMKTKTLIIEGMMCPRCEAHVRKALEAIEGVESATVSHTAGTAVILLSKDVEDAVLKQAVEEEEYKVTDIR